MTKILIEKPPIWDEAHQHFDINDKVTIYSWGEIIYNPAALTLPQHIIVHEETHGRQQWRTNGPENWWRRYFDDAQFRLEQEIEAYHQQYNYACAFDIGDRNKQVRFLHRLASDLASPLYKVPITQAEAMRCIKAGYLI